MMMTPIACTTILLVTVWDVCHTLCSGLVDGWAFEIDVTIALYESIVAMACGVVCERMQVAYAQLSLTFVCCTNAFMF